ncbi:Phosphatidate cytidylyltransferase 5, chloroplastic [Vitis vinifera]|uniref:phosphatidate cytidylyltransferase n=1 Tax=Vitis vinifera TaxID=29760 RepID=A0A438FU39_VITVI|nr:Phosphatidate cytidylyltransferase 5, chloroplastic [Vitis vinifera]
MASCIEIDRYGLIPLAVAPLPCRRPSSKTLVLTRPSSKFSLGLVLHGPRTVFRINRRRFITAVARTEPDRRGEDSATETEEVDKGLKLPINEDLVSEHQQKESQFKKRVVFGLGIGILVGGVVLAGGWVFTAALAAAVFIGAREYFELVRSHGITAGMTPPPRYVSRVCSVICAVMPLLTLMLYNANTMYYESEGEERGPLRPKEADGGERGFLRLNGSGEEDRGRSSQSESLEGAVLLGHRDNSRKSSFSVESKTFEIEVEEKKGKTQFVILKRKRGISSWVRMGIA